MEGQGNASLPCVPVGPGLKIKAFISNGDGISQTWGWDAGSWCLPGGEDHCIHGKRAGVLRKPPQRCPEKGNGNGLRNLKSTHNCFKNLVPYFQHIPAASDAAIGLPKLSFISLLQCNEGLLPQLARF